MSPMPRPHVIPWLPLVGLLVVVSALAGCRSETHRQVRAQRDQNLRDTRDWWHTYNARGEGNLEELSQVADAYRESRRVELERTRELIRRNREYRRDRWYREKEERRAWWRRQVEGQPEAIEPALGKVLY